MRSSVFIVLILLIPLSLVAEIRVISQSPDQISLEYRPEAYQVLETGGFTEIRAQGMALPLEAGVPALPYSEIKVAIPPKASISVSTHTPRSKKLTLESKIKPSPRVSSRQGESGNFFEIDEASYHHSQAPLIEALEESSFRGYAFVPIIINPFRYDGNLSLETVSSVIIEIRINGDTSFKSNLAPDEPARIFLKSLINAEYAAGWRNEQRSQVNYADFSKSDVWVRIETNKEGMHKISPSQLSFLNLEDIDPSSFRLFTTGGYGMGTSIIQSGFEFREVPIQVIGADDGSFDPEDYIVFFGTDRSGAYKNPGFTNSLYHNPYSQNGVFWLTHAGEYTTEALRMEALPKPASHEKSYNFHPHTVRVEQEAHRWEEIGFNWFMQKWFGQTTSDYTFNVNLEDVVADSLATLSFSLIQENIGSVLWHRMNLYINDQLYQQSLTDSTSTPDLTWYSTLNYNFNRNTRLFQEGTNTLRFKVFRSQTINYFFDYYEISYLRHLIKRNSQYPLKTFNEDYSTYVRYSFSGNSNGITVYQAQNYADVKILTHSNTPGGFEFIGSGNLNNSYWIVAPNDYYTPVLIENYNIRDLTIQEQIDNLIITIPEFSSQADELAEFYNQTYGIHSKVVMQDDIFNQFNGGHPDPVAIRQYIRYLYHNQPAPRISSLTMLGIGTIDWRNYSGQAASKNKVIVFQQNSDTSDDLFGLITTSFYPEIAIGRYPVRNSSELNTMLNNMYSFVQNPNQGEWKNKVLIVADDLMNGISQTGEYYHTESAEATNLAISRGVMVDMVLGIEHDYDEFQNKPSARDAMMKVVNDGTLVWYYIGHGSYDKLGAEDYFNGATDMGRFNNPDKLNLFIAASCEVGQFDYWGFDALSQKVVTMNNQGSIASVAATRKTPPTSNEILMIHFLRNVVNNRYALGFALSEAKRIFSQGTDNNRRYVLLGDPLLRVIPPAGDSSITIYSGENNSQILKSRQLTSLQGAFPATGLSGQASVQVFNPDYKVSFRPQTEVTRRGNRIFRGLSSIVNSAYNSSFIVPDDVKAGTKGTILNYTKDSNGNEHYVSFKDNVVISDEAAIVDNIDAPKISLYLGSMDFRDGDTVGTNPMFYAAISDSNGINLTGSAGHNILLILDNAAQPLAVTNYFTYDLDSYTSGLLSYPLSGLSEGNHQLQLIAFDNFNKPAVANTSFNVKKSGDLSLERLLPYPNPMKKDGHITFILSLDAEVTISFYTMAGRKIRTVKAHGVQGFNQIYWDGRDGDGKPLANNTYFIKVIARTPDKKKVEKTERIVIYK